jgi:hypothetical protein
VVHVGWVKQPICDHFGGHPFAPPQEPEALQFFLIVFFSFLNFHVHELKIHQNENQVNKKMKFEHKNFHIIDKIKQIENLRTKEEVATTHDLACAGLASF